MNSPFGPTPDPYTTPPQWLPAGTLLNNVRPDTGGGSMPAGGGGQGNGGWGGGGPVLPPSLNSAQVGNPGFDLFGTSANFISVREPSEQNYMTQYYIQEYNALRCDMYFNDLSGGIDAQIRHLREGIFSNELAYSTATASFSRSLNLPPLLTADSTSTNEIGTLEAMSACYLNDGGTARWLVAAGDTADKCLFSITSTVTAQAYTPSSNIVSLTTVKIATNTERVIVGRAGAAAQVLTGFNGTPTTSGTMHANTTGLWGCIRSPLNSTTPGAETLLLYCNDGLYSLSSTAAISDAPTSVLTNWPGGGYALGIATLSTEGVARAYWVHPLNDSSVSMLDGSGLPGRIVSTNLEGTDPKYVDMGLPFVKHAMLWRGGIVATDGKQIHWNNGDIIDLGWNRERLWGTAGNGFGFNTVLAVIEDRLLACTGAITSDVNDLCEFSVWEEYIPENNTWQFFSYANNNPTPTPGVAAFTGRTPVYQPHNTIADAGYFWWYHQVGGGLSAATYQWENVPLLPSGVNPQWQQSEFAYISYKFDDFGEVYTPVYHHFGYPIVVSDIQYGGEMLGEDSLVTIEIAQRSATGLAFDNVDDSGPFNATFAEDTSWTKRWWINPNPQAFFDSQLDRLRFRIAIAQGTSGTHVTKTSPNALPFRVGFYVYLDGKYTPPNVMEPRRYWGNIE